MSLAHILVILQIAAAAAIILIGSLAEAYGYGLSLGTSWPYRRDILRRALEADPEAWHRTIATTAGVNAVILALLRRDTDTLSGLGLSAATAVLGFATLNVLAGRAPAFLHGLHELLAYGSLCAYVSELLPHSPSLWGIIGRTAPLRVLLLVVFLGGMLAGQRGFKTSIGTFVVPRTKGQWVFIVHLVGWLLLLLTLAYSLESSSVAFFLALLQVLVGFGLYQSVNSHPGRPGILALFHQAIALLIFFSLMFAWEIRVSFLG